MKQRRVGCGPRRNWVNCLQLSATVVAILLTLMAVLTSVFGLESSAQNVLVIVATLYVVAGSAVLRVHKWCTSST